MNNADAVWIYIRVTRRTTFSNTVLLFGFLYYMKQRTIFYTTFCVHNSQTKLF